MWEYQSLYRVSAQLFTEGVFHLLDRNLRPEVFLLGLAAAREEDDPSAICLEPQTHRYAPESFRNIRKRAETLEPDSAREIVYHLHTEDNDRFEKLRWYNLLRRAAELELQPLSTPEGRVSFCSLPVPLNGYLVMVVLQLSAEVYHSYYALHNDTGSESRPPSLLMAVVREVLLECSKALRGSDAEEGRPLLDRDYNELLRAAGRRFMHAAAAGNHGLYDACNGVASLRHEGDEGRGIMLLARRNHLAITPVLTLEAPVPLRDQRSVRKLLEMSEGRTALISDATQVFGLGQLVEPSDPGYEPLFTIHFTTHYNWELSHNGHVMMRVVSGTPRLPQGLINESTFAQTLRRLWPDMSDRIVQNLWSLAIKATTQPTGTILIFSEGAAGEALRLSKQCFRVAPRVITPSVLRLVTNIDGAVLIDPRGICYAIGAILDGLATERGDSSRGSRYNSALRYVDTAQHPTLAVVVSEDGYIDLLPSVK